MPTTMKKTPVNTSRLKYYSLLLLFASCTGKHDPLLKALQQLDKQPLSAGHYVIIPNQGCDGCISTAESFVKSNHGVLPEVKYIFTRTQSYKLLRIKLGSEVMNDSRVMIDSADVIPYPEKGKEIYPMIVSMENGEITDIKYQSPGSDGLSGLLDEE